GCVCSRWFRRARARALVSPRPAADSKQSIAAGALGAAPPGSLVFRRVGGRTAATRIRRRRARGRARRGAVHGESSRSALFLQTRRQSSRQDGGSDSREELHAMRQLLTKSRKKRRTRSTLYQKSS